VVNSTRNYIHFCAAHPELNRIILSEIIQNGDRLHWLAENHVRQFFERAMAWMAIAQDNGVLDRSAQTPTRFAQATKVRVAVLLALDHLCGLRGKRHAHIHD
jgi:hypothetical protein